MAQLFTERHHTAYNVKLPTCETEILMLNKLKSSECTQIIWNI